MFNKIILIFTIGSTVALEFNLPCPIVTPINLDESKIVGDWYENQRFRNELEHHTACGKANFESSLTGGLKITYNELNLDNNQRETVTVAVKEHSSGLYSVNSEIFPDELPVGMNFLASDYDNYLVVLSCYNRKGRNDIITSERKLWIYSRKPTISEEHLSKAIESIRSNRINDSDLVNVTQVGCDSATSLSQSFFVLILPLIIYSKNYFM